MYNYLIYTLLLWDRIVCQKVRSGFTQILYSKVICPYKLQISLNN